MTRYRIVTEFDIFNQPRRVLQFEFLMVRRWPRSNIIQWRYVPAKFVNRFRQEDCDTSFCNGLQMSEYPFNEDRLVAFTQRYPNIDDWLSELKRDHEQREERRFQESQSPVRYLS